MKNSTHEPHYSGPLCIIISLVYIYAIVYKILVGLVHTEDAADGDQTNIKYV
jgi:hypothetical protein